MRYKLCTRRRVPDSFVLSISTFLCPTSSFILTYCTLTIPLPAPRLIFILIFCFFSGSDRARKKYSHRKPKLEPKKNSPGENVALFAHTQKLTCYQNLVNVISEQPNCRRKSIFNVLRADHR